MTDKQYIQVNHPVLTHKLSMMRNKSTQAREFRRLMNEVAMHLALYVTEDLELETKNIETPLCATPANFIKNSPLVVSVMRAGNGMLDGVLQAIPNANAGHIGIYRDKFIKNTVEYYFKLPETQEKKDIILLDPLLATGDTAIACIDRLKQYNVGKITMMSILVSGQGLEKLHHFHPDVKVYALNKEEGLNDNGYLLPGIGDAGDRLFQNM